MTPKSLISRIQRGIFEMMNAPFKYETKPEITQHMRLGDKTLREMTENGRKVVIVQAAQINMQQTINEEGTKVLDYIIQLQDLLEDLQDDTSLFQALLNKHHKGVSLRQIREEVESTYAYISTINSNTKTEAAKKISISRGNLLNKLKLLPVPKEEPEDA